MKKTTIISLICSLASLTGWLAANAQSLPGVQKNSVFAPVSIKVDGDAKEWDHKFQANNKSTNIFYTISNDNNRLYIVAQVTDPLIIKKIIGGGLVFTFNTLSKKDIKDERNMAIFFPRPSLGTSSIIAPLLNDMAATPEKKRFFVENNKLQFDYR